MAKEQLALLAHLMRRAGFGATPDELERYAAQGYEGTVEELLHPEEAPPALDDEDVIRRYHIDANNQVIVDSGRTYWIYRMVNTRRPLEEMLALFWHGIFATGYGKLLHVRAILRQIDMFRRYGLGSFRDLLVQVSRDPAMIFRLDNKDNHGDAVNENYGRELLELFSMDVGNYTEDDVRQASQAFTGWTIRNASYHATRSGKDSVWPYGRLDWQFLYKEDDHDVGEKTFLGQTSAFDGEEIIDVICRQPATARFIARHLYNFFVADEAQVPTWETVPPRDPEAIRTLADAFVSNDYQIRPVLRVLFSSDFFKESAFARVKSPVELVAGTARLSGGYRFPDLHDIKLGLGAIYMGQSLLDPPSVEGWRTGQEWINSSALVERVNFAVQEFADANKPGLRSIIDRIRAEGPTISPERLVEACLEMMGYMAVSEETRRQLLEHAKAGGELRFDSEHNERRSQERIKEMVQLTVSTREYQMA